MKLGIIGYGSMGKMLLEKADESGLFTKHDLLVANRTYKKISLLTDKYIVCESNGELAKGADVIFLCVRPSDMKAVLTEICGSIKPETLLVSLNGSIAFEQLEKVYSGKLFKVIPSVTAEVNKSQTLVCCNSFITHEDKARLFPFLKSFGEVIELPETEMEMGAELVSCMPGFIAAIFGEIEKAAEKHTEIPREQIVSMLLNTMVGTGQLMLEKGLSFDETIDRVATKGGITEVGASVIHEGFPSVCDEMFRKTLEKRALTAQNAKSAFKN